MVQTTTRDQERMSASINMAHGRLGNHPKRPQPLLSLPTSKPDRQLTIYPAHAGYDMEEELDHLSWRAIEPNVFFTSRFLAPAMPRLEDREIRLAIIRDETADRSRLRLLIPFSVEKPGFSVGSPIIRVWSNPFAPLGTPLLDTEAAAETIDDFLDALGNASANLPKVLVLPDIRLNGPFIQLLKAITMSRNLPVNVTGEHERPMLESLLDGETYLRQTIKINHIKDMRRQWNGLEKLGRLAYCVSRQPDEIRKRMEEFLLLEASGWKGRKRSAMLSDRYRAAFAREAVHNLAAADNVRIHTIDLDGRAIASMVVFMMNGEAYTWKTAFDESYSKYSPGKLLVAQLTDWHLDDPNIIRTDSCAVENHPLVSRFWKEREAMGTLVIGLTPNSDRDVRQVTAQLHLYENTRNVARILRRKIMALAGR
jgi:CelD/BcsL family acetyltransferase involved in cellulose biosynthesis